MQRVREKMTQRFTAIDKQRRTKSGYTLLELLVVMVIVGILATQVVFMLTSVVGKVKGATFNMRSDFNLARAEAVNRNTDVLVDFVFNSNDTYVDGSGNQDGYRICIDDSADNICGAGDTLIKDILFTDRVQFYDVDAVAGPPSAATVDDPIWPPGDGVTFVDFTDNYFFMQPDGTSNEKGTVYLYAPRVGAPTIMDAPPFAVVVSSTTGRILLMRYNLASASWATK